MRRKPSFATVRVIVAEEVYHVIVRKFPARLPAHVGADSPRYLEPGSPPRVQVLRILKGGADVTSELSYWLRQTIETAAIRAGGGKEM